MKNTMKLTAKLLLIVSLFCSIAFAEDGNMGSGTKACTENCRPASSSTVTNTTNEGSEVSVFDLIGEYLFDLFG